MFYCCDKIIINILKILCFFPFFLFTSLWTIHYLSYYFFFPTSFYSKFFPTSLWKIEPMLSYFFFFCFLLCLGVVSKTPPTSHLSPWGPGFPWRHCLCTLFTAPIQVNFNYNFYLNFNFLFVFPNSLKAPNFGPSHLNLPFTP